VRSHGWYDLAPFTWDEGARCLSFVFLDGRKPVRVEVVETGKAPGGERLLRISSSPRAPEAVVRATVHRVLDLGAGLGPFHDLCRARAPDGFGWIAERGAGRILRAPSLFEDTVKVLATTNCTWAFTRRIVENLIGVHDRGGAFPDAPFVAGLGVKRLGDEIRLGYRAPYLAAFAEKVASAALDLRRWEDPVLGDAELEKEIRSQPGFGPYAAQTLGRLLGRHARLGLDSWSRKKVAARRFRGRATKDARVERFYAPFGRFAGLAFWLDVTRDWHDGREKLWP
jgi:N-glycosylase/DNA lyase